MEDLIYPRCKFSGTCAVVHNIETRKIFCSIFKKLHPDVIICPYAYYIICDVIITDSLEFVLQEYKGRYFITNPITGKPEFLSKDNLKICCSKDCCDSDCPDLYTMVYD